MARQYAKAEVISGEGFLRKSADESDAFTLTTTLSPDIAMKIAKNIEKP